jgi:protein TonB
MAYAAVTSVSIRTVSLSLSTALWVALVLALSIGARVATETASQPRTIEGIRIVDPPPPVRSDAKPTTTQRAAEGPDVIIAPIQTASDAGPATEPIALVEPDVGPVLITRPNWLRRPTAHELAAFYPPLAIRRERSGVVSLDCLVRADGALSCSVLSETPTGYGFGEAALRISRTYRMEPATRDGRAVEARYQLRVPFELH